MLFRCPDLLEARDSAGRTPLLKMAGHYRLVIGVIEALVDAGADVLATDNENQPVLFHVFYKDTALITDYIEELRELLQFLLRAGADPVQGSDRDGNTLLMRVITSNVLVRPGGRGMRLDPLQDRLCSFYLADILNAVANRGAAGVVQTSAIKEAEDDEAVVEQAEKRQRL